MLWPLALLSSMTIDAQHMGLGLTKLKIIEPFAEKQLDKSSNILRQSCRHLAHIMVVWCCMSLICGCVSECASRYVQKKWPTFIQSARETNSRCSLITLKPCSHGLHVAVHLRSHLNSILLHFISARQLPARAKEILSVSFALLNKPQLICSSAKSSVRALRPCS